MTFDDHRLPTLGRSSLGTAIAPFGGAPLPTGAGLGAGPERTALVAHTAGSVRATRDAVVSALRGVVTDDVLDAAVLVLSELVSNAVKHARPLSDGGLRVSWRLALTDLTVSATDGGGATRPRIQPAPASPSMAYAHSRHAQSGGRGLDIVDRVSSAWGVTSESGEVTVWAMLPLTPADGDTDVVVLPDRQASVAR